MKQFTYIFVFAIVFCSCNNSTKNCYDWGKQVHYPDFLFCKFVPDTLFKTLSVDESNAPTPFELQLRKKENNTYKPVSTDEVQIYANGKACPNNVITIHPGAKKIRLGLVFSTEAIEGKYKWYLMVHKAGKVEIFNGQTKDNEMFTWNVKKKVTMNPFASVLLWIAIIFSTLVVAWFTFLRRLCIPTFTLGNMQVLYFDGEVRAGREDLTIKGVRKIICSTSPKAQSGFNRLVFGRIEYLTNPFWTTPVEMTPFGVDQISVQEEMCEEVLSKTYHMGTLISATNGPKRPFIAKKKNTSLEAKISVG